MFGHNTANQPTAGLVMSGHDQHNAIKSPQSNVASGATNFLMINPSLFHQSGNLHQNIVDSLPVTLSNSLHNLHQSSGGTVYALTDQQIGIRLPIGVGIKDTSDDHSSSMDKNDSKVDIYSVTDDKGVPGLAGIQFQDGGEQTSPGTPSQTSTSQILHYRPSAKSGDAMLSAINYNDSDMLPDGAFDSCLPNLDDGILSNMGTPGNIRMSENLPDLFDGEGNVNDSYSMEGLSPQPFTDSASGFVGDGNLGSVIDPDGIQNPDSNKSDSAKKKSKNKQPKSQGSPGRQTMQCPSCNKTFNNSSALAKHRLTHSDERKYVCNLCQKAFKRQDHLNGHLMTHRDKKPYECNVDNCQKSYCDARSLRRHLENHHNQTPEQIQTAIAAVASNATAIIAAAAASNTASLRATPAETQSMPSTLSVISGASNSHSSQDGNGSQYSTPQYSNNSTPITSPTYSNNGNPQQQTTFFQFDQVPSSAPSSHDVTLQQPHLTDDSQRQQQITIQPQVVTPQQTLPFGQLPEGIPVDSQQVQNWEERVQHILTAAANQAGTGHQSNSHSPPGTVGDQSPSYLQQVSPISPVMNHPGSSSPQRIWSNNPLTPNTIINDKLNGDESAKPVVCSICERRFKNIPALNGHMRLHGGYFKKDINKEEKKSKKAQSTSMGSKVSKVSSEPLDINLPTISQSFQKSLETITPPVTAHATGPVFPNLQSPVATPETPLDIAHSVIQQLQQHQQQQQIQEQQIQLQQLQQQEQQLQQQLQQQIQQIQLEQQQLQQHLEQQNHQQQEQLQQVPHVQKQQLVLQKQIQQLQREKQQLTHHLEQKIQQTKLKQQLEDQHLKQQQQNQLQQQQQQFQDILQQHQQHNQSSSVPQSPQVPQSPLLQRQVSVESLDYQFQSPPQQIQDIPSRMSAQLHLQQLARQQQQQQQQHSPRDIIQQMDIGQLAEQLSMTTQQQQPTQQPQQQSVPQHVLQQLNSPPPISLNSMSIQSNLQSAIAQIPQFTLQTPNPQQEVMSNSQTSFVSPSHLSAGQVTLVTTSADNPELSVAQLLNGINGIPDPVGSVFCSQATTTSGLVGGIAGLSPLTGNMPTLPSTLKEENSLTPTLDNRFVMSNASGNLNNIEEGATIDLDSATERLNQEIMGSLHSESKAADNPFSFPTIDSFSGNNPGGDLPGSMEDHHNPGGHFEGILSLHGDAVQHSFSIENSLNTKSDTKSIQNRHQELKRRLSVGSEVDLLKKSFSSGNQHNKSSTPITYVKHNPSSGTHVKTDSHVRPRMRSKSGDDYNLMRASSEDHTFMRPRSRTEDSLWRMKSKSEEYWGSPFSKSDGAGLFRNPNTLSSPIKLKRKHRPAPLFIPPHMNNCGFQSRLRSPRINPHIEGRGNTPPPYTPPPMLSPIRSGSGLFCSMYKPVTPMSAPIAPRSLQSVSSRGSIGNFDQVLKMDEEEEEEAPLPQEPEEPAPETDVQPHVNIGSQYQAEIPPFNSSRADLDSLECKEDLMWDPSFMGENSDHDVQYYQEFACSSAVKGNGANVEYALHLLRMANGNIQTAMLMLMSSAVRVPRCHSLQSYTYQESTVWSTEEVERYQQALMKCDKDFLSISKEVETKSTGDCVQFYYLWKKVCPDEHKRLRVVRRKREQDQLYNLRTRQQQQEQPQQQSGLTQVTDEDESDSDSSSSLDTGDPMDKDDEQLSSSSVRSSPVPMFPCEYPDCTAAFGSKQALNAHGRIHGSSKNSSPASSRNVENRVPGRPRSNPPANKTVSAPTPADGSEVFPCKLCGRVFAKVKSRSAHMKIHRLAEGDRKQPKPNNVELTIKTILPTGSPNG
ncbi:transcriptional-regulating factor 1-like isoform X2 [Argopecten irradians]|uniref:transcriptional-regulating factor 1-like isoform X2 n=1 Tax=Argopecten irradians TaxID=31199 RepID=UPI0037220D0E